MKRIHLTPTEIKHVGEYPEQWHRKPFVLPHLSN
jgi:hypothetical protein